MTIRNFTDIYDKLYIEYEIKRKAENDVIKKHQATIIKAKNAIKRARIRKDKLKHPEWTVEILKEMAKEMIEQFFPDDYVYSLLGSFGIASHTVIWIHHPNWNISDPEKSTLPQYSFEVEPVLSNSQNGHLQKVDRSIDTKVYPKGSLGEMNGFNNPTIPIDDNITLKDFIKLYYPDFFK